MASSQMALKYAEMAINLQLTNFMAKESPFEALNSIPPQLLIDFALNSCHCLCLNAFMTTVMRGCRLTREKAGGSV